MPRKRRVPYPVPVPLLLAFALAACRQRPHSTPSQQEIIVTSNSASAAVNPDAAMETCPTVLAATRAGGMVANAYHAPSEAERLAARSAFAALARGRTADVRGFGFESVEIPEWPGVTLLREVADQRRGGGAYILRSGSRSNLVVQAPHTFYDEGTLPLACDMFQRTDARALFINTAHRYKSAPETRAGEHPADVAHAGNTLFLAMTEGLLEALPSADIVQLHGFQNREASAKAVLSTGERRPPPPLVLRARAAFEGVVGPRVMVFPEDTSELGATTNVEGMAVRRSGGRFLHIEMDGDLRRLLRGDAVLRGRALDALAASFR